MNWTTLLFSPRGRVNRARYWLAVIVIDIVFALAYVPFAASIDRTQQGLTPTQALLAIIIGVVGIVVGYIGICLGIKRFHDRDKSGWWVLISFVPVIGGLWYLIEVGFLRGTTGTNRFGPDPLAPNDDIVRVFGPADRTVIR